MPTADQLLKENQRLLGVNGRLMRLILSETDHTVESLERYVDESIKEVAGEEDLAVQNELSHKIRVLESEKKGLMEQRDKLQAFKDYVHERLDKESVPVDPDPEKTKETGCLIGARLDVLFATFKDIQEQRDALSGKVEALEERELSPPTESEE